MSLFSGRHEPTFIDIPVTHAAASYKTKTYMEMHFPNKWWKFLHLFKHQWSAWSNPTPVDNVPKADTQWRYYRICNCIQIRKVNDRYL